VSDKATWFESLVVGGEYYYHEEGGETLVSLVEKLLDCKWAELKLRAIRPIYGGNFGEIHPGEEWTCGAMLSDYGYPNAYCGWSLRESARPEVKR
jgi:hypothetical protein